jgi:hypothetical protein
MNAFSHVFDPLDLEIIDRVYEAALAQLEAQRKLHDREVNERVRDGLRKRVMACADAGQFDFDTLYNRVVGQVAEQGFSAKV